MSTSTSQATLSVKRFSESTIQPFTHSLESALLMLIAFLCKREQVLSYLNCRPVSQDVSSNVSMTFVLLFVRDHIASVQLARLDGGAVLTFVRPARKTLRFLLQTAVTFWWTNGNGEARQGEGRSRDVSEHGAFIFASSCPPVGTSVVLKIDLEGIPDEIGRLPVEVEGEVLRAEQCPAERGMLTGGFAVQY
jgi:hypothetical protein